MNKKVRPYSESDLVSLLVSQERKAFEYLYDNYSAALYGVLLKIVGKAEVSEDLLQDTFVKIWKNVVHYDATKGRFFTWMLNIARNTGRDYLRTQRYEMPELSMAADLVDDTQSVFRGFDRNDVRELIYQLKTEHKAVIEMVYWEGYTYEETAERLHWPLGTVKTRVRDGLIRLRFLAGKHLGTVPVFS